MSKQSTLLVEAMGEPLLVHLAGADKRQGPATVDGSPLTRVSSGYLACDSV